MNNPFGEVPSYIKEMPMYSKFLELVSSYIVDGAKEVALFKSSYIVDTNSRFVINALAKQLNVDVDVPFVDGVPDVSTYFSRLLLAYLCKSFKSSVLGRRIDFISHSSYGDVGSLSVIDFSVDKENKSTMSVLYSVYSMKEDLTIEIVRDFLIPRITGVNSSLYYLQLGQTVFGYDADDKFEIRIGNDHVNTVPIEEGRYTVATATISDVGSGYKNGDIIETADGIKFQIPDVAAGAFLFVVEKDLMYSDNPTTTSPIEVIGGSGTGMTIMIDGEIKKGYYIRGFDNGAFVSITRR